MALSRRICLAVLGLSAVFLVAASWTLMRSATELSRARAETATAHAELARLRDLLPLVEQQERYDRDAQAFQRIIEVAGLNPDKWANRKVQHTAAIVPRAQAEKLLTQQVDGAGTQWFAAERFDVAVVDQSAGLFTWAGEEDRGFSVEMTGKVFFPLDSQ